MAFLVFRPYRMYHGRGVLLLRSPQSCWQVESGFPFGRSPPAPRGFFQRNLSDGDSKEGKGERNSVSEIKSERQLTSLTIAVDSGRTAHLTSGWTDKPRSGRSRCRVRVTARSLWCTERTVTGPMWHLLGNRLRAPVGLVESARPRVRRRLRFDRTCGRR